MDEVARAALLVNAYPRVVPDELWARGDNRERQAVLRALPLLPEPERFAAIAIEACRTNVLPVFEAIACENPYPARYFPERNFNQMVLKAAVHWRCAVADRRACARASTPSWRGWRATMPASVGPPGARVPADIGLPSSTRRSPMKLFDPHIHMTSRTTDDYEAMARAGIRRHRARVLARPAAHACRQFIDYFTALSAGSASARRSSASATTARSD